jgi:opacity protein-like surface antigen
MRRAAFLALILILAGVAAPAQAQQATKCTAEFVVTLDPGVGPEPSSGTFHSPDDSGTIDCGGAGSGSFRADGRYGTEDADSCSSGGEGWGIHSFTLGGNDMKSTFTFDFGGISGGLVNGTFDGETLSGTFTFRPTKGDCVTGPATEGVVNIDGTMKG